MNFWKTTMFFCHFWWGHKQAAFEVFNNSVAERYCGEARSCIWEAHPYGIRSADLSIEHYYKWR
ncbi:hypothetical protein PHJA_001863600 [Phtheirospermum japonicum]|uniref:S-protein homolog n=1 Tax=Phtheirospermum japonicum TaxID=374723 RepID=A0A830CQ98_9LAMI|nr:hypothetical protein PHJA_001863600 [Phtheirospermum japonicum]